MTSSLLQARSKNCTHGAQVVPSVLYLRSHRRIPRSLAQIIEMQARDGSLIASAPFPFHKIRNEDLPRLPSSPSPSPSPSPSSAAASVLNRKNMMSSYHLHSALFSALLLLLSTCFCISNAATASLDKKGEEANNHHPNNNHHQHHDPQRHLRQQQAADDGDHRRRLPAGGGGPPAQQGTRPFNVNSFIDIDYIFVVDDHREEIEEEIETVFGRDIWFLDYCFNALEDMHIIGRAKLQMKGTIDYDLEKIFVDSISTTSQGIVGESMSSDHSWTVLEHISYDSQLTSPLKERISHVSKMKFIGRGADVATFAFTVHYNVFLHEDADGVVTVDHGVGRAMVMCTVPDTN